jgi:hypothetical protein
MPFPPFLWFQPVRGRRKAVTVVPAYLSSHPGITGDAGQKEFISIRHLMMRVTKVGFEKNDSRRNGQIFRFEQVF